MAKVVPGVLGSFAHIDAAADAIRTLRAQGHRDLTVYSSCAQHELEAVLEHKVSPVRLFTLIGGITGCAAGLAMTFWMSLDWPLLVGGKPIATVPPYVVIMFELTVLIGSLVTVAAVAGLSLLRPTTGLAYDEAFTDDQIGVFVACRPDQQPAVEKILASSGSVEVRRAA